MRTFAPLVCCAAAFVFSAAAVLAPSAQTFSAVTGSDAVIKIAPDVNEPKLARPGHHATADEPLLYGQVRDGVYTVDGMVAKLRLNYDVNGARYLYMFVPGVGTAVLSLKADPDAVVTEAHLRDNELTFAVGDHRFKLTGVALSDGRNSTPEHLFVRLDRAAWHLNRQPMVGFGNVAQLPYAWPGALPPASASQETRMTPPVPADLLPSIRPVQPAVPAQPAAPRPVSLR